MFEGDTGDPATLAAQIDKIKARLALKHVVLVHRFLGTDH
jgi:hypothetical protein